MNGTVRGDYTWEGDAQTGRWVARPLTRPGVVRVHVSGVTFRLREWEVVSVARRRVVLRNPNCPWAPMVFEPFGWGSPAFRLTGWPYAGTYILQEDANRLMRELGEAL